VSAHPKALYAIPAKPSGGITGPTIIAADSSNTQIGPYTIKKDLGEGTFGQVKLGQLVETGQFVAIKIMNKASAKTPKQKVSVQREVRLMKLLDHPHIVGVIDVFETPDLYIVIMEVGLYTLIIAYFS
jgi:serine/threonine protein kinase